MLCQDVSFGLRLVRRQPGFVALAIGGTAIAIAVSTAVVSVVNAVALRPLGIADPAGAVRVWRTYANGATTVWRYRDYLQLRESARLSRPEDSVPPVRVWISNSGVWMSSSNVLSWALMNSLQVDEYGRSAI